MFEGQIEQQNGILLSRKQLLQDLIAYKMYKSILNGIEINDKMCWLKTDNI